MHWRSARFGLSRDIRGFCSGDRSIVLSGRSGRKTRRSEAEGPLSQAPDFRRNLGYDRVADKDETALAVGVLVAGVAR